MNVPVNQSRIQTAPTIPEHGVSFGDAFRVWARVAALSFGGPAGQIAVMHRIIVEEKRWIGEDRFLHALNYCMLLPGPEAHQLAIYIGWLLHKTRGGLVAGILFVLPGFLSILILSLTYVAFGHVTAIAGFLFGLKAAVLTVVIQAVLRIGQRALRNNALIAIAVSAFLAIFLFSFPFPLIVAMAGTIGLIAAHFGSTSFQTGGGHKRAANALADKDSVIGENTPDHATPNLRWSISISLVFLSLWLGPVLALYIGLGPQNVFSQIAIFFSKMAMVTFGGAYAVLSYVAQEAVQRFGWVTAGEMLDGLGMAETTPGPLIQVVQFVGFLGAYRSPGDLNPYMAATLAAVLTTWVTFLPCFLWIFLGAPFIETLRGNKAISAALTAITASVVGVIMNLAIWFAMHVLFQEVVKHQYDWIGVWSPVWDTLNVPALVLTVASLIAAFVLRMKMIPLLLLSSLAGLAWYVLHQ